MTNNTYNNGPEGMPRVKRMTDSVLGCLIDGSRFRYLANRYEGEDLDRLHALMHDVAEEALARVPAWRAHIDAQLAAARAAQGLMQELVKLWDSDTIYGDDYNEAMCALEQRIRALVTQAAPTQAAPSVASAIAVIDRGDEDEGPETPGRYSREEVLDMLEYEIVTESGARKLRDGEGMEFNLTDLALLANRAAHLATEAQSAIPRVSEQDERARFEAACAKLDIPTNSVVAEKLWKEARASLAHSAQAAQGSRVQADAIEEIKRRLKKMIGNHGAYEEGYGWALEMVEIVESEFAAHPAPSAASAQGDWIADAVRDVAELPDRDSPADQPEMMLVSADELTEILQRYAGAAPAQVAQPSHETIVQEGASLVCTACGTAAQVAQSGKRELMDIWNAGAAQVAMRAVLLNARAVIKRWESPLWRQEVHTAEFINQLRKAVDAAELSMLPVAAPVAASQPQQAEAPHHFACERKGYNPLCAGCDAEQGAHQARAHSEGDAS